MLGGRLANLAFIGAISYFPHFTLKLEFIHKLFDRLVIDKTAIFTEFQRYTPVSVTSFMLMEYDVYHIFYFLVLVLLLVMLEVIIECTTRHLLEL